MFWLRSAGRAASLAATRAGACASQPRFRVPATRAFSSTVEDCTALWGSWQQRGSELAAPALDTLQRSAAGGVMACAHAALLPQAIDLLVAVPLPPPLSRSVIDALFAQNHLHFALWVYFKGFCQLGAPPLEPAQYVALCQCAMRDDHPNQAFRLVEAMRARGIRPPLEIYVELRDLLGERSMQMFDYVLKKQNKLRIKDPKYKTKFFRKQTEALARFQVSDYPDSAPGTFF